MTARALFASSTHAKRAQFTHAVLSRIDADDLFETLVTWDTLQPPLTRLDLALRRVGGSSPAQLHALAGQAAGVTLRTREGQRVFRELMTLGMMDTALVLLQGARDVPTANWDELNHVRELRAYGDSSSPRPRQPASHPPSLGADSDDDDQSDEMTDLRAPWYESIPPTQIVSDDDV